MNLHQYFLTLNPCYKSGRTIAVKGLMLHSVGCPQPDPMVFIKNWNSASYDRACVHGFIGGAEVYETLPMLQTAGKACRGWHGGGASNNTHIGVEMCEPSCIKYTGGASFTCSDKAKAVAFVEQTTQAAVELFAALCKLHNLNPLAPGVIISHAEGYKLGIATNHGDPEHLWRGLGMDYNMDKFRAVVAAEMEDDGMFTYEQWKEYQTKFEAEKKTQAPSDYSEEARTWAEGEGLIAGDATGAKMYKSPCTREHMVIFLYRLWLKVKAYIDSKNA